MSEDCTKKYSIAIDFCGVLSSLDEKCDDINITGAIEALTLLKKNGHKLYIVSFCGKSRAIKIKESILKKHSGIFDGMYFVKDRKFKGYVTKFIGADIIIDDSLDVLCEAMKIDKFVRPIWFSSEKQTEKLYIQQIQKWTEVIEYVNTVKYRRGEKVNDEVNDIKSKIYNI